MMPGQLNCWISATVLADGRRVLRAPTGPIGASR
jgi:hypothetical protein